MGSNRILVIQRAYLGDLILTLPLVRRIHAQRPAARITLAVRRGFEQLVRDQPAVSAVLSMRKRTGWLDRWGHDRGTFRDLRAGRFDTVYLAHRSFRSGLYAWATRAPHRVGFSGSNGAWACTERVRYAHECHLAERLLALTGAAPRPIPSGEPWFSVSEQARLDVDPLLRARGLEPERPWVILAPGSAWATKRWTTEGFARLARWLQGRGFAVVLVGTQSEKALCERVRKASGSDAVNLAGATALPLLAALLARSRMLIGNDSGTGHLAAAVGTPVITIFGPTTPELGYRPLGRRVLTVELPEPLECRPCGRHGSRSCPRGHHRCMRELSAEEVVRQIEAWDLNPLLDTRRALHEQRSSRAPAR